MDPSKAVRSHTSVPDVIFCEGLKLGFRVFHSPLICVELR